MVNRKFSQNTKFCLPFKLTILKNNILDKNFSYPLVLFTIFLFHQTLYIHHNLITYNHCNNPYWLLVPLDLQDYFLLYAVPAPPQQILCSLSCFHFFQYFFSFLHIGLSLYAVISSVLILIYLSQSTTGQETMQQICLIYKESLLIM